MRILHVISSLGIGGAERLISDMLPQMKTAGMDVSLLVYRRLYNAFEKKLEDAGIAIISLEAKSNYSPRIIFSLAIAMKEFDVIHVHLFPSLYQVAVANLINQKKLIYTEHNTTNRRRNKWYLRRIEKRVYNRYYYIVSVSRETQDSLVKWLGEDDCRFTVINNGIDISLFDNLSASRDYPFTLLMVSRFAPAKDQETVVRAMQRLSDDTHVIFVGDGETRQSCVKLSIELNVARRCHFVGNQENVPYWISKADIGIQASHWEGFGLTAVEMMAGGLPVVASDVEGLKQVVDGAGILFKDSDDKELATIIDKLRKNKAHRTLAASQCVNRASLYSIKKTAECYMELYQSV